MEDQDERLNLQEKCSAPGFSLTGPVNAHQIFGLIKQTSQTTSHPSFAQLSKSRKISSNFENWRPARIQPAPGKAGTEMTSDLV